MSWWTARGRARVSASNPRAFGQCDCCGFQYNLEDLSYQYQWAGQKLINQHFRVCPTCLDVPSHRYNPYAIPADPVPVYDPRIENFALEATGGTISWELGDVGLGYATRFFQWEDGVPMTLEEI